MLLPSRRTRQPQQSPLIDWSNPVTRGLVFAWVPTSDVLLKSGVPTRGAGPQGVNLATNGTTYAYSNSAPLFSLDNCSITALLTPVNTATLGTTAISCGQVASGNPLFIL